MDVMTQITGILAGVLTTISIVPQIIKGLKTKAVDNISSTFLTILLLGVGLWTVYGYLRSDWPIIVTNGVSFIFNGIILLIYFKNKT